MPSNGHELIARWREAGAWWAGEKPIEVRQWRDPRGVKQEKIIPLDALRTEGKQAVLVEERREEYSLRPRKTRDEKVRKANGLIRESLAVAKGAARQPVTLIHAQSGLSFGFSSLLPAEIPRLAATRGYTAALLADKFSLAGAVEFIKEAKICGIKPLVGASIELEEGGEIVLIAQTVCGWRSLCAIISEAHMAQPRLHPLATFDSLRRHAEDLICLTGGDNGPLDRCLAGRNTRRADRILGGLVSVLGRKNVLVEIERSMLPWGLKTEKHLRDLAQKHGLKCVAGMPIRHDEEKSFPVQDVLVCAQTLCTAEEIIGRKPQRADSQPGLPPRPARSLNSERFLRTADTMADRYVDLPELIEAGVMLADLCDDEVLPQRTKLPKIFPNQEEALMELVRQGAESRIGEITPSLRRRLNYELSRIVPLGFADHFLIMWDVCRWAKSEGILFSGRGSVVDSTVAFCLGISRINAHDHNLHFDRFLPDDGSKRPDIDIDFEAAHRDRVREYMTRKYGRENVATVSAFGVYCVRGIVREVGKVLELPSEMISFLAKRIHRGVSPDQLKEAMQKKPELRTSDVPPERLEWVFRLSEQMMDVPRNIRAHSSGVVISDRPIWETVPVMLSGTGDFESEDQSTVRIIQWDKRSAKHFFDKFDVLCLRGQDVLAGTERRVKARDPEFDVEQISLEDPETYRTMRSGELIGIPQSASPAMRQAHVRIRTRNLTDASLVQAGIRPGVGGSVKINELIARRRGLSPYEFDHPELERILGHTYGIVVFQEQIDQLLQAFVGCSAGEAEDIREEIHKRRREDYGETIKEELMARMKKRGISTKVADHVFELVAGFKGYGFAQGHALAFAEISVRSIWCQQHYPAEYFAAMLDAQPAGYYGPCTLANEARSRGVKILPPRVGKCDEKYRVEDVASDMDPKIIVPHAGLRVGLHQISGLRKSARERMVEVGACSSVFEFVRRVKPNRDDLERLILIGYFDELHPNRRALMWVIPAMMEWMNASAGPLGIQQKEPVIPTNVEDFGGPEKSVREREILNMDVDQHLMGWERERVSAHGCLTTEEVRALPPGERAMVVGNPIRLRFPPTPSGRRVVFFDLEDETGLLNTTCFDEAYRRDGSAIVCSPYVTVIGHTQWRDGCTAFLVSRVFPYQPEIRRMILGLEELPVVKQDFLVG
jgi:error-prone DNA polymerase